MITKHNYLKSLALGAMTLSTVSPMLAATTVFAADDASTASSESNAAVETTDPGATLKSMVSVNGNPLTKDKAILPGDDVTWDIIATPGNTGLMTYFQDQLPRGIKLSPNSTLAIQAFNINNDGTQGDEITSEGTTKINGQTVTWTPKDPTKYFYVGGEGQQNRILFHISTVAQQSIDPDFILENLGTLRVTNPKNPNTPVDVTSKARVHTVRELEPTLTKSVSDDDGATWTDFAKLANKDTLYEYKLAVNVPVGQMKSSLEINDPMVNVQKFNLDQVKVYRVLPKAVKDVVSSDASSSASSDVDASSSASDAVSSSAVSDTTSSATDSSAATSDTNSAAALSAASDAAKPLTGIVKTNDREQDVTDKFTITKTDEGDLKAVINYDYAKTIRDSSTPLQFEVVVNGVTFKTASAADLQKYLEGGMAYIPNTATATVDKTPFTSNRTRVTTDTPADPKKGAISKSVSTDDGKSWLENGQLLNKDAAYDYKIDVIAPLSSNLKTFSVTDEFLAGQTVDKQNLAMYMKDANTPEGSLGTKVTDQGAFVLTKSKAGNTVATWTASPSFVSEINEAKDNGVKFSLVANGVTIKNSTADQLKTFLKNGTTTVPNVAGFIEDGKNTLKSNKVTITLPPLDTPKTPKQIATEVVGAIPEIPGKVSDAAVQTLANTGAAIKAHPFLALLGLVSASGTGYGVYKFKKNKRDLGE